jgi:bacterioferritin-associated ferredoxin
MPDDAEVCGCNGVCKGTIVKAIKEKGLFTLDDVRKHTKAVSSCGSCTGLVEQILASTVGGAYQPADTKDKPMCGCTDHSHGEVRQAIREQHLLTIPEAMQLPGMEDAQRLRLLPPGAQLLPDLDLAAARPRTIRSRASSTSAPTPTSRRTAPTRWCRACGAG